MVNVFQDKTIALKKRQKREIAEKINVSFEKFSSFYNDLELSYKRL